MNTYVVRVFAMFAKTWRLFLIIALTASAGDYRALYLRLAHEMDVQTPQSKALQNWIEKSATNCRTSKASLEQAITCMRHEVYDSLGVSFDSTADHLPVDLLPSHVLYARRGSCVPVTFLVLMLAEQMGITAQPISLPGHVYVSFPAAGINWEPNRQGFRYQDDEYQKKYDLDPGRGRIAHRLSDVEFEGMLRFEAANRLVTAKRTDEAILQYTQARTKWRDPRIVGNMALALESKGNSKECLRLLDSLWTGGVRSEELVWNRALAMLRNHQTALEVQIFLQEAEGRRVESPRLHELAEKLKQVKE